MQELQLVLGVGGSKVHLKGMGAGCAVEAADAGEGGLAEGAHEARLVVPVGVAHKVGPQRAAQPVTHVGGKARGGGADQYKR